MKTTFDLPEPLLRRAKAAAAHQGRPLRDLVAEAIEGKLAAEEAAACAALERDNQWNAFAARLQKQPDGSYFNPEGIEDQAFFEALEEIRRERAMWEPRDPFAGPARATAPRVPSGRKPKAA